MKDITAPRENFYSQSHESDIVDTLTKKQFYTWMDEHGFDMKRLREVFDSKRLSANEQCEFNFALRQIKEELHIPISASVIYLEQFFTKMKKVLNVVDEDTKYILTKELSEKYKIDLDESILDELLEN